MVYFKLYDFTSWLAKVHILPNISRSKGNQQGTLVPDIFKKTLNELKVSGL